MASTYSNNLKLELMETGANANTWGNNTNTNLQTIDAFAGGYLSKSVAGSANVTLTTANADPTAEASNKVLDLNGTLTGNIHVFLPAVENNYLVYNNTAGAFTVNVAATGETGVQIDQGKYEWVYCDGTNVSKAELGTSNASELSSGTLADARLSSSVPLNDGTNATFTGNVALNDSVYLNVGTGSDLQIYHDGSNSYIKDAGTGNLTLLAENLVIQNASASQNILQGVAGGKIALYYAGSQKLETTTNGIQITNGGLGVGTDAGATDGEIRATGDITAFYTSDETLKTNIANIENPMEKVSQLNGVTYDWTDEYLEKKGGEDGFFVRKNDIGVIAQEVEKVLPQIVGQREDGTKAVKYDRLCALLIECVKDLQSQIDDLKKGN